MTTNVHPGSWVADARPPARILIALLAIPILAVMAFAIFQPIKVLPRIGLAPGYSLTDQDGSRFTSEDLRGGLSLYTFTYTGCEAPCPQTGETMRVLQQRLAAVDTGAIPVQMVTISFDPEQDTPEQLATYAARLGADTSTWHFVTGDPVQLKTIIGDGFSTYYGRNDDGTFTFDPVFALVDGWGIVRAIYRTATPDPEIVARDVGLIVQEVENSEGINRYAYEAAHLFLCYPK